MEQSSRVHVSGPLAGCAPELIRHLAKGGYTDHSVTNHVRRLACLSRWMEAEALDRARVDEALIAEMLEALHAAGKARSFTPCSFGLVLGFLRVRGLVPGAPIVTPTPVEELLGAYRRHLVVERSLAPLSLPGYLASAAWFLSHACGDDPDRVAGLSARDVASFVLRVAEVRSPASVNTVVVGVRSLLRWFYAKAMTATPLAQATPWLARGCMSTLPRPLGAGQASALLATPDRHLLSGLRDIAVLTVLVRLGLRAGEVAAMELDDIDWHKGELDVRGKGGWRDRLPLPVDVGEALADYLRARGERGDDRHVFAHVRAPGGPMTMTSVRAVVRQACRRAGIADTGTHRLRHGAAGAMLAHGAPLHEIGQILRHRDIATTAIYAKVDFATLATVAQPWPGSTR
jgi:site-specific recombinase XerD